MNTTSQQIQQQQTKRNQKKTKSKSINKNNSDLILSTSTSSASSSSSIIIDEDDDSNNSKSNNHNRSNSNRTMNNVMVDSATTGYDSTSLYTNNYDANSAHIMLMNANNNMTNYLGIDDSSMSLLLNSCSQMNNNNNNLLNSPDDVNNPFLNEQFTSKLTFNADLNELDQLFEQSLHLIDEQDNFFDIKFMTNYVSYILIKRIKQSNLFEQFNFDLKSNSTDDENNNNNLLKEIAKKIYLESESEPCGLKGCKLSIYLDDQFNSNDVNNESPNKYLLNQFKFDPTSSLTTFELNLTLKTMDINNNIINSETGNSLTISTLTRRFLNRSSSNASSSNKTAVKINLDDSSKFKIIYLDSFNYELTKLKLY